MFIQTATKRTKCNKIDVPLHRNSKYNEMEKFINLKDVCEMTGFSKSYVYQLTHEKKIPHYKPTGSKLFFKASEVAAWIEECKIKSIYEE